MDVDGQVIVVTLGGGERRNHPVCGRGFICLWFFVGWLGFLEGELRGTLGPASHHAEGGACH